MNRVEPKIQAADTNAVGQKTEATIKTIAKELSLLSPDQLSRFAALLVQTKRGLEVARKLQTGCDDKLSSDSPIKSHERPKMDIRALVASVIKFGPDKMPALATEIDHTSPGKPLSLGTALSIKIQEKDRQSANDLTPPLR